CRRTPSHEHPGTRLPGGARQLLLGADRDVRAGKPHRARAPAVFRLPVELAAVTTYLDHAATTPVRPEVADAYAQALQVGGNPSSLHAAGRAARRVLEEARESIAADLGAHPTEVLLTAGGTEADNLAVQGIWRARAKDGRYGLVTSAVEHHAVLETAQWLAADAGADLHQIGVDATGVIDTGELAALLAGRAEQIGLISVMWANIEVGTIQAIDEIVALAAEHDIPVHSDAVQVEGERAVDVAACVLMAVIVCGVKN